MIKYHLYSLELNIVFQRLHFVLTAGSKEDLLLGMRVIYLKENVLLHEKI